MEWRLAEILVCLGSLASVIVMNLWLRKDFPTQLYLIWYIFSFAFVLFFGLVFAAETYKIGVAAMCGSYETACQTIYGALTNLSDEIVLLVALTVLGIGPQLMAYGFSGIFGAARPPKFVKQIEQVVLWSAAKFLAILSGILAATGLAKLTANGWTGSEDLVQASMLFPISFGYVFAACKTSQDWSGLLFGAEKWLAPLFIRAHKFMTRNAREE